VHKRHWKVARRQLIGYARFVIKGPREPQGGTTHAHHSASDPYRGTPSPGEATLRRGL